MTASNDLSLIVDPPCWKISPVDFCEFLRHLPNLTPSDSVLCLEGVNAADVEKYLQKRPASMTNETDQGFLKTRAKVFYTPITEANVQDLAALAEAYAEPEVCGHLRVYRDRKILLSWHDLPLDTIYIAREIDEAVLKRFCIALRSAYTMNSETTWRASST